MKKVGIITLFHRSLNFGGVLQACALCKALDQLGIPSEQIRCVYGGEDETVERTFMTVLKKLMNPKIVWKRICYEVNHILYEVKRAKSEKQKAGRRQAFDEFIGKHIPVSKRIYTASNVHECLKEYDAFITGSDQVWNPEWFYPIYFLSFVPSNVSKISYAASLGKSSLTENQQAKYQSLLQDFKAISVRETDAVDIIAPLAPVEVSCVLDPTLLLSREQWDEVCAERLVEGDYLFYYFLGKDAEEAALTREYARKTGLKIAGIPNAARDFSKTETITYDHMVKDASPAEFLSLIRYAKCVVTDSFHATVFANVFEKEYFVFPRAGHPGMTSRIERVATLFETMDRFCDVPEKKTVEHMQSLPRIDWNRPLPKLEEARCFSFDFLKKNLGE